jgi:putative transposase
MARVLVQDQWSLSDDLWEAIALLIPERVNTHPFGGGKAPTPDRVCMEAIFFVLRTGCQWKALDATRFCPGSTAHDRFQRWVQEGVFLSMWEAGLMAYDEARGLDWSWLSMDGCMTKAPLGGKKTGKNPTDRAKQGVKRSLLVEANGIPVGLAVDGANRNDMKLVEPTLESIPEDAARPKPSKDAPQGMCMDKGYDYDEVRDSSRGSASRRTSWRGEKRRKRYRGMKVKERQGRKSRVKRVKGGSRGQRANGTVYVSRVSA